MNLFAFTPAEHMPGYVSINKNKAGDVTFSVRGEPVEVDGQLTYGPCASFTIKAEDWNGFPLLEE